MLSWPPLARGMTRQLLPFQTSARVPAPAMGGVFEPLAHRQAERGPGAGHAVGSDPSDPGRTCQRLDLPLRAVPKLSEPVIPGADGHAGTRWRRTTGGRRAVATPEPAANGGSIWSTGCRSSWPYRALGQPHAERRVHARHIGQHAVNAALVGQPHRLAVPGLGQGPGQVAWIEIGPRDQAVGHAAARHAHQAVDRAGPQHAPAAAIPPDGEAGVRREAPRISVAADRYTASRTAHETAASP